MFCVTGAHNSVMVHNNRINGHKLATLWYIFCAPLLFPKNKRKKDLKMFAC